MDNWEKQFEEAMSDLTISTNIDPRHLNEYKVKEFISKLLESAREESIKDFARAVIDGGMVDETDFNYFLKEYLAEQSEEKVEA